MSLLMGMEKHSLRQMHGEMKQGIRLNYYSPCAMSDLVLGVRPHSDINSISLLLQEDEITGLQIRHKESWVPVNPIPISKCVVNIGDVMEGCSNWVYKNIEHRAVTNQTKARISTAAFVIPEDQIQPGKENGWKITHRLSETIKQTVVESRFSQNAKTMKQFNQYATGIEKVA
nr:protein SRG1 [Ipomoea batatas]